MASDEVSSLPEFPTSITPAMETRHKKLHKGLYVLQSGSYPLIPSEIARTADWFRGSNTRSEPQKVIDIDDNFMASVCKKIPAISRTPSDGVLKQTIYRVPVEIRSLDEMAYTPRVVCIGPLFDPARTNNNLKQMQDYKWSCLSKLISKGNLPDNPDTLNRYLLLKCLTEMKKLGARIRASYSENIGISDNELALMMVLDGCFILHRKEFE